MHAFLQMELVGLSYSYRQVVFIGRLYRCTDGARFLARFLVANYATCACVISGSESFDVSGIKKSCFHVMICSVSGLGFVCDPHIGPESRMPAPNATPP